MTRWTTDEVKQDQVRGQRQRRTVDGCGLWSRWTTLPHRLFDPITPEDSMFASAICKAVEEVSVASVDRARVWGESQPRLEPVGKC